MNVDVFVRELSQSLRLNDKRELSRSLRLNDFYFAPRKFSSLGSCDDDSDVDYVIMEKICVDDSIEDGDSD